MLLAVEHRGNFATSGQRIDPAVIRAVVDEWAIFDNSGSEAVLLEWGEK